MGLRSVARWLWIVVVLGSLSGIKADKRLEAEIREDSKLNITRIDLNLKSSIHLFRQWQDQAVSGLMAAVASKKISKVSKYNAEAHERCAKSADTVLKHAQCVSELLRMPKVATPNLMDRDTKKLFNRLKPEHIHQPAKPLEANVPPKAKKVQTRFERYRAKVPSPEALKLLKLQKVLPNSRLLKLRASMMKRRNPISIKYTPRWRSKSIDHESNGLSNVPAARKKRYVVRKSKNYQLQPGQSQLTPLGLIAKQITQQVLAAKHKKYASKWQSMILRAQSADKARRRLKLTKQKNDPLEELAIRGYSNPNVISENLEEVLENKSKRKSLLRLLRRNSTTTSDPKTKLTELLRGGMKLAYKILGKNTENFDEKNLKVLSPKLLSISDSKEAGNNEIIDDDPIDVLSPSLLSLHDSGKGLEKDLALPSLVKGFTTADQQQWLDLIFEAAGVEESLQKAEEALKVEEFQARKKRSYEERMRTPEGQPLYFTKEKAIQVLGDPEAKRMEVSEALIKSYTAGQLKEMNETGYAILNKQQLELFYGSGSPYENLAILASFRNMTEQQIHDQIEYEIKTLRNYTYDDEKVVVPSNLHNRTKRAIVASPIIGSVVAFDSVTPSQPIILTPILFTTVIGSPAILGPIVLGPWLFLPVILSPRTLSPPMLSPFLFVPVVLSPLTLQPSFDIIAI